VIIPFFRFRVVDYYHLDGTIDILDDLNDWIENNGGALWVHHELAGLYNFCTDFIILNDLGL
jgi:hypothetical protein